MMQSFLMAAHEKKGDVLMTWIKQVRNVAYDSKDQGLPPRVLYPSPEANGVVFP
jgi:hypothetical protein